MGNQSKILKDLVKLTDPRYEITNMLQQATGVSEPSDISYSQTNKVLTIMYGDVRLDFDKKDLFSEGVLGSLEKIGVYVKYRDKDKVWVDLYYRDTRIVEYVK